tara:strand:+ start:236 stop:1294 length:1059 start_codon:yes stop_codon:yes gene_type:complete
MQVLSYPLNVEENDGHYILFTIFETPAYEYKSPYTDMSIPQQKINSSKLQTYGVSDVKRNKIQEAISKLANVNYSNASSALNDYQPGRYAKRYRTSILGAGRGATVKSKDAKAAISLYTPQQIKVSHKMNYQAEDVSFVGGTIAGFLDTLGADRKLAATGTAFKQQLQKITGGIGRFAGTGGAQQAIFGTAVNQNLAEVIFTGLEYRTFSMEFSMMPKSKQEAKHVDDIINTLTYYALPNRKSNSAQTFDIPAEFNMKYMYYSKENKYIHPALTLALESIDISYGGQKFATFRGDERGAQPVRTDITLTFRELELADRHTLYGAKIDKDKVKNEVGADNRENFDRMKGYLNS